MDREAGCIAWSTANVWMGTFVSVTAQTARLLLEILYLVPSIKFCEQIWEAKHNKKAARLLKKFPCAKKFEVWIWNLKSLLLTSKAWHKIMNYEQGPDEYCDQDRN